MSDRVGWTVWGCGTGVGVCQVVWIGRCLSCVTRATDRVVQCGSHVSYSVLRESEFPVRGVLDRVWYAWYGSHVWYRV